MNNNYEPIASMRVMLACPESPHPFLGVHPTAGLALTTPPQHGPAVVDMGKFSLCRLTFDLAERVLATSSLGLLFNSR